MNGLDDLTLVTTVGGISKTIDPNESKFPWSLSVRVVDLGIRRLAD